MSTARVYERERSTAREQTSRAIVELDSRSLQALLRRAAAALDKGGFKKALFIATLAAAGLYYLALALIAILY
jgi:hypothetical protein